MLFNTPWIKNLVPSLWPYWGLASSVGRPSGKKWGEGPYPWRADWDLSFSLILAPEAKQVSLTHHHNAPCHDKSAQAQNETRSQINLSSREGDYRGHFVTAKERWLRTSWGHAHHSISLPWVSAPVWAPMHQRRAVTWCSEHGAAAKEGLRGYWGDN